MARLIREKTRDGAELVEFALAVLRSGAPGQASEPIAPQDVPDDPRSRMFALQWLSDRGFGKAMQDVDVLLGVIEITPEQQAMIGALRISPHERRERIAELRARRRRRRRSRPGLVTKMTPGDVAKLAALDERIKTVSDFIARMTPKYAPIPEHLQPLVDVLGWRTRMSTRPAC